MIHHSKISAKWILEVRNLNNDILRTYEFADTFLDSFFAAANGFSPRPLGFVGGTSVKWGYGDTPVSLSDKRLATPAKLPARYSGSTPALRRWPTLKSAELMSQPFYDPRHGNVTAWSCGPFTYDLDTRVAVKKSGGVDTSSSAMDLNLNPLHGAWFEILHTEVTDTIREIGTAVQLMYYDAGWLDSSKKPVLDTSETPWGENETSRPGLDYYSGSMFHYSPAVITRALIRDAQGNPTGITLAAGEKLRVKRELQLTFTIPDQVTTQNFAMSHNGVAESKNVMARITDVYSETPFWMMASIEDVLAASAVAQSGTATVRYLASNGWTLGWCTFIPAWDWVSGTWKSYKYLTDVEEDKTSDELSLAGQPQPFLNRIVVYANGDLPRPPGYPNDWKFPIVTFELAPAFVMTGKSVADVDFSFKFRRYVTRG